ncbi:Cobalt/magnesium transport protein CorA [uncultured archaeon]|nr:Cobalt/magnesium transport protein CorA [uncultured archaeon]
MTSKIINKIDKKSGKAPGTVTYIGKNNLTKVSIDVIDFTKNSIEEFSAKNVEEIFRFKEKKSSTWINISGVHDTEIIKKIGAHFGLHPLLLEDVADTNQRPKIEEFKNELFFVLKMIYFDKKINEIRTEQVSIILGKGFVISFLEDPGDIFDGVRERIRKGKVKIRNSECDYLAYSLIDAIIDNYFIILEGIGEKIEQIEDEVIKTPGPETLKDVYSLKRELILLRKSVWPIREVIGTMLREDSKFIKKETREYLRDLHDHTIRVIETLETFRDMLSGMLDLYTSNVSNKMNEVMKVLTIISTLFIPLTFIVGVYGMNFEHMPELSLTWFYPSLWVLMIIISLGMLLYFKKKKWI